MGAAAPAPQPAFSTITATAIFGSFTGAKAMNDPKIAVAVIVENAGWGAGAAAPIARRVFDYWLANQYPSEADLAAIKTGKATAPIGKPRVASEVAWPAPVATPATAP